MMSYAKIRPTTTERIAVDITTDVDPIAGDIEFQTTAIDAQPADGDWEAGTWNGVWTDGVAPALTPTIGDSNATITLEADTVYVLWYRVGAAFEEKLMLLNTKG